MLAKEVKVMVGRILCILILTICTFCCNGCNLLENLTSDIDGWDISACISGFDTCWELYFDNADKFEDGFIDAINTIKE